MGHEIGHARAALIYRLWQTALEIEPSQNAQNAYEQLGLEAIPNISWGTLANDKTQAPNLQQRQAREWPHDPARQLLRPLQLHRGNRINRRTRNGVPVRYFLIRPCE